MNNVDQLNQVSVEASRVMDAPIERLWALVADFNNLPAWHPDVTESRLEEATAGVAGSGNLIRAIKLRNGQVLRERLISTDAAAHSYTYSVLDGQLPLKDHVSSVTMHSLDSNRTEVTWKASFVADGAPPKALADGVRVGVLELGLQGLAERVRQAA